MAKITGFWAKIEKSRSKQFEHAVSPTNVIFGQINPLGGFYKRYARIFHILSFWPIFGPEKWKKWQKPQILDILGVKMGENGQKMKNPT